MREVAALEATKVVLVADPTATNVLEVFSLHTFVKAGGAPLYAFEGPPDPLSSPPKLGCLPGDQILLVASTPPGGLNVGRVFTLKDPAGIEVYEEIADDPGVQYEFHIRRRVG